MRAVTSSAPLTVVSAASYSGSAVAPDSIVAAFGSGLAGATVTVKDAAGTKRQAEVLFSAATQVNFVLPATAATGKSTVTIGGSTGEVLVESVAPGLFSANGAGAGVGAASAVRMAAGGTQSRVTVFQCDAAAASCTAFPIEVAAADPVYLSLYGTGMRAGQGRATASIAGISVPVAGPIAQRQCQGLDQLNLGPLPQALAGRGETAVMVTVDGKAANSVTIHLK